jgi:hypothetical protein
MSLLEKASGGHKNDSAPAQARTSLFTRAMAATREDAAAAPPKAPVPAQASPFLSKDALDDLKKKVAALPPRFDSILYAWSILSAGIPLAAIALFLPQEDFLSLAAQSGFPAGTADPIPFSLAPSSQKNGELLASEAKALIAPLLGVDRGMELRATSMWSDIGLAGLWIYHDASLETSSAELRSRLRSLLAGAADSLPASSMARSVTKAVPTLQDKVRKYRFAAAFRFDLEPLFEARDAFRGITRNALRSAFLSACGKILAQGGVVLAYEESLVACALGSSSPVDSELAIFQLTKTLKRILPFLAGEAFPEGRALGFDPSSDKATEELSRFLSA